MNNVYQRIVSAIVGLVQNLPEFINWLVTPSIPIGVVSLFRPGSFFGRLTDGVLTQVSSYLTNTAALVSPLQVITTGLVSILVSLIIIKLLKNIWDAIPVL